MWQEETSADRHRLHQCRMKEQAKGEMDEGKPDGQTRSREQQKDGCQQHTKTGAIEADKQNIRKTNVTHSVVTGGKWLHKCI